MAKPKTEADLLAELCQKHGYTMLANKPKNRRTMMMSKRTGKMLIEPYYLMQLAVPMESDLAKRMLEQFPEKAKAKAKQ